MSTHRQSIALGSAIALGLAVAAPAAAQNVPKGSGWGARMMMEPIVMAHGGFTALCNPRAARLSGWGVDQIEKVVKPSESQRAALDDLRAAAVKAADLSSAACPRALPQNSGERLVFVKQRLAALLQATTMVAQSFDTFYASLSEEQKARVDTGPRRWRWRS
jgi:hypothetical protein